jgi:uncharacterized membrane protein
VAFSYYKGAFTNILEVRGASASGINNHGDIVGSSRFTGSWIWRDSKVSFLPLTSAQAFAINNQDQVTGGLIVGGGGEHLFVYCNGQLQDLGALFNNVKSNINIGLAINDHGQIAGQYLDSTGGESFAFFYSAGIVMTIPVSNAVAYGINNSGQVVGTYNSIGNLSFSRAFLMTPIK